MRSRFDRRGSGCLTLVAHTPRRESELLDYVAHLVKTGRLGIGGDADESTSSLSIRATVENGRLRLARIAAMRHARAAPARSR